MSNAFILLWMLFFHIVDDYYLQGWLASAKQKEWWRKQENYSEKYKSDYAMALYMHSFSWAFMIMLPLAYHLNFNLDVFFIGAFFVNCVVHMITDNAKANSHIINLVEDQFIHIVQIILTFVLVVF